MSRELDETWRTVVQAIKAYAVRYEPHQTQMVETVVIDALQDDKVQAAISDHLHQVSLEEQ